MSNKTTETEALRLPEGSLIFLPIAVLSLQCVSEDISSHDVEHARALTRNRRPNCFSVCLFILVMLWNILH